MSTSSKVSLLSPEHRHLLRCFSLSTSSSCSSPPAAPRQCIDLFFDDRYSIEPSWECKFDHIEVRDGPFGFSPLIGRYCGQESPAYVRSSGRYLYIKFVADSELEAIGFSARYNFTQGERVHVQNTRLLLRLELLMMHIKKKKKGGKEAANNLGRSHENTSEG